MSRKNLKNLYWYLSSLRKETSVNNLIKNLKAKNLAFSKANLKRQLLLALDSSDEEEGDNSNYVFATSSSPSKDEDIAPFNEKQDMHPEFKLI